MSWPNGPDVVPGGTYILDIQNDRSFAVPEMVFPDHFTIKLPPNWPKANGLYEPLFWTVTSKLTFGKGCVIDLSPQEPVPPQAADGGDGADGGIGTKGGNGGSGAPGRNGISGVDLTFNVQTWAPVGSLWIRTDGLEGGSGGNGGNGGRGGPGKCDLFGFGGPDGGDGGDGGNGSIGGRGGDTSVVHFELGIFPPGAKQLIATCPLEDNIFAPSPAPPATDDGIIRISGAPGRGGRGGRGGIGGPGGDGDNCGFLRKDRKPGGSGSNGQDSTTEPSGCHCFDGPNGKCRRPVITTLP